MKNHKSKSKYKSSKIYVKVISWLLVLAIVLPLYFVTFIPPVFARLRDAVKDMGGTFNEGSEKHAFIGIDPETGTEVYFFDGAENIKITDNGVTDGNAQYDEFSNKIVFQSLIDGIWHIFLYDIETDTTLQLSYDGINNVSPQISQGQVVWQSWIDGHWEIYYYDGIITERLSFNETPDIEPKISNGYIVWRQYEDTTASGSFKKGIDSKKYEIVLFDLLRREIRKLTDDKRTDSSVDLEYPYVVWQTDDGNDTEIIVHYISTNNTAFLTNNDYDDLAPRIKNGKIKWLEKIEEPLETLPENVIEENGETKLRPLPEWWNEPIKCPQEDSVCTFVEGRFESYANRCYAEKAKATILHTGVCTRDEEVPDFAQLASSSIVIELDPEIASDSETTIIELTITPELEVTPEPETIPELSEDTTLPDLIVSSSEGFEDIASPSVESTPTPTPTPTPTETIDEETIYSEPGTYENTGSFNEEGDLIIEEHIPANLIESDAALESESFPVVEDAQEPVVFEESTLMKIGEAVNNVITDTASAAANILGLITESEEQPETSDNSPEPQEEVVEVEVIEVIEEPME